MDVKLKEVVLSMPYVFEASAYDADSDEKFSAHFIIEPGSENDTAVRAALMAEAEKLWKDKAAAKLKAINSQGKIWCLRDGDGKTDSEGNVLKGYAGKLFVSAKNTVRPLLLGANRSPVTQADDKMYPGAVVTAIVDIRVNNKPSDQAYAYLKGIQFVRDGVRLGGGSPASVDDFDVIPEKGQADVQKKGAAALF
ncbi:MAG: ssDNA-binding protein [Pseudomonadota bacterium]